MELIKQTPKQKQNILVQDVSKLEKRNLVVYLLFISHVCVQILEVEQKDCSATVYDRVVECFER
jgi:hypothetical protein